MKDLLKFLVKLIVFSALLFAARDIVLNISQFLLMGSCSLLGIRITPEMLPYDSSDKLIPFIALVLATPSIRIKKRVTVIALGFTIFFLMDLASIILWVSPLTTYRSSILSEFHSIYSNAWNLAGRWIFPFVIWILATRKEIGALLCELMPVPQTGSARQGTRTSEHSG